MAADFNVLLYGELDNVRSIVESRELDNGELRAVLMNLIDRIQRAEQVVFPFPPSCATANFGEAITKTR